MTLPGVVTKLEMSSFAEVWVEIRLGNGVRYHTGHDQPEGELRILLPHAKGVAFQVGDSLSIALDIQKREVTKSP